jgi:outer membrane protein OmpA-like peptidoglycan-associated protein
MEARLLCDGVRLVAPAAVGLADVEADVTKVEERLAKAVHPVPIDDAARARARCLDLLTRARRSAEETGATDTLLSELSAAGPWAPSRDERGIVVVLHDVFHGNELTDDGTSKLKELGRVASAHPTFAVEVVVHDAQAHPAKDATDEKRAQAAVQALVAGGATASRVKPELAGTAEPLVDPSDAKARGRNERLEVTFVASGR